MMQSFTGNQWNKFYEFVSTTGLNLIACLSGGIFNEQTDRDLSNALEFITFSSKNNFNMNWQLGYGKYSFFTCKIEWLSKIL